MPTANVSLIDLTIEYTRERQIFGRPILDNQAVHFRLAELRTEVESLRALTWHAVDEFVAGNDVTRLASMAKLKTGRLAREVADSCLQYWGGMGYTADNRISRAYRDGRLISIGAGADEVMLGIIAKLELPTVLVQEGGYLSDELGDNLVSFLRGTQAGV